MATVATTTALVYSNAALSVGDNTIVNGTAGKRIYITQYAVTSSVPVTIQSTDETVKVVTLDVAGTSGATSSAVLPLGVGVIATVTSAGTASGYLMGFMA